MRKRLRWREAQEAAKSLKDNDRRTLWLLACLPLLPEDVIERLYGLRGAASVYRCLARLRKAGLVATVQPAIRDGRSPRLAYLTNLGLATVAVDQGVEPDALARRNRLRGPDLLARLAGLPCLLATYRLLAALAGARPGRPDLLAWEQPWRRRYRRPTARVPATVALPAYAALSWGGEAAHYLLVPDVGTFPLRVYRGTLGRLLALRAGAGEAFPLLVVATTDGRRAAWGRLLEELNQNRAQVPLAGRIATWEQLSTGLEGLPAPGGRPDPAAGVVRRPRLRRLVPRRPASPIPCPVGDLLRAGPAAAGPARRVLELAAGDHALLDLVGRHPFLPVDGLAAVLGWTGEQARSRRDRLVARGLLRLVEPAEVGERVASGGLVELTTDGLELVAARQGLTPGAAIRHNGLVGGGPDRPRGPRRILLKHPDHTLGVDALFVGLYRAAARLAAAGRDVAVLEWRSAAACSRRRFRPDGYGMLRCGGRRCGFFLEYDRGTMRGRDYREKWAAYYEYRDSRRFERDYDGFPTVLVVTTENAAEERIARAARAAAVGRWPALRLLLTCEWRIHDPLNPNGLLGPIWREPDAEFRERRLWPATQPRS